MAQQAAINNALGNILGYLGSEVATPDIFDRLLWPGRFFGGFGTSKVPKMIFFMPMGGPLHKAALTTLDKIHSNGLLKGRNQGHMLGSPFYHDTRAEYTVYDCADTRNQEKELVRNGFWTRVFANLPIPQYDPEDENYGNENASKRSTGQHTLKSRAIHRVSHLRLSVPTTKPPSSQVINGGEGPTLARTYFALIVTETTGVAVACTVAAIWRSWFMVLWLVPLILKLASAFFAVERQPLEIPTSTPQPKSLVPPRRMRFDIHGLPHGFLIIEGYENLVVQFFRHYGHPVRNRFREWAQIIIIILFGLVFPVGLLCSLLWMPLGIQYIWMGYQLYATCTMHIYRLAGGQTWATTEEQIANFFATAAVKGRPQTVFLAGKHGVLKAELEVTYHNRYRDGKFHCEELLHGKSPWSRSAETLNSVKTTSETVSSDSGSPRSSALTGITKQEI
ncbi:hypothetical protein BDZ45DRAFT_602568 [Acephala macrosclerotiorum]|nr:hypothetical protein BDZ45DRAFT_602568 [Acephala macrosclerotiorum]